MDELFSRAVVAQLAEQRAQRETFAELERRLEALEHLVTDRLTELSRLVRSGEVELRLELLEEEFGQRFSRLEIALKGETDGLKGEMDGRLEAFGQSVGARLGQVEEAVGERLGQVEAAIRSDRLTPQIAALEQELTARLAAVEGLLGDGPHLLHDQLIERLSMLEGLVGSGELSVAQRLGLLEEKAVSDDVSARLVALEQQLEKRFGSLEDQVRGDGGETLERLKSLETAVDERSSRLERHVRANEVEQRLDSLTQSLELKLDDLKAGLPAQPPSVDGDKLAALDQAVSYRLTRLEGSFRQLEGQIASRLDALAEASKAAEVGILERIIAESQVVGSHFQAVKPVVEALATAGPDLEAALAELRDLAELARTPAGEQTGYHGAPIGPAEGDEEDTVFLPPEETPIPDRRFGSIFPRRES